MKQCIENQKQTISTEHQIELEEWIKNVETLQNELEAVHKEVACQKFEKSKNKLTDHLNVSAVEPTLLLKSSPICAYSVSMLLQNSPQTTASGRMGPCNKRNINNSPWSYSNIFLLYPFQSLCLF